MKKVVQETVIAVPMVGQVYRDRDPRMHGRRVEVIRVDERAKRVTAQRVSSMNGPRRLSVISFHILAQKFRLDVPTAR